MKHTKRDRTKQLITAALRSRGYYISVDAAHGDKDKMSATVRLWYMEPSTNWVKLTASQVLADMNFMLSNAKEIM